jgi:hypothetical protein
MLPLLLACTGDDPGPSPAPETGTPGETGPVSDAPADMLSWLAQAEGFAVGEGLFTFSTFEHCCDADANCLGNNPSTPYGMIALPPAPDAQVPDVDSFWMWGTLPMPGVSRAFRLRPDEAYVWIGTGPPRSKYFSYRSSIATRENAFSQRDFVLGSLGPSLNQLTVAADRGVPPDEVWGETMALVTASDEQIEATVDAWLVEAGIPATHIHHDRISATDSRFGLDQRADTFMGVMRVAVPDDPAALATWQESPPARVLRLTPPDNRALAPMGRQPLPQRGSGEGEQAWMAALGQLEEAIRRRWSLMEPRQLSVLAGFTETYDCIYDASCFGDIRDRYATRILETSLPDDEAFVVVFGINHERAGRVVYSNFAVMTFDNRVGVAAVDSAEMVGSARPYLGDDYPLVDDLFAWVLSRDCSRFDLPCLQVPAICPYPEYSEPFYITSRMYLDPATGAAPGDGQIVPDRIFEYHP